ncbi:hypothetical protein WH52_10350 [Tenacibaculum holothuriorum]|uniref:Uncharacterized protein n=1 Tax=Tenacibaculum holothuriorum TaxID=1635173 RepID=A0A1Y2PBI8_9FLAO|nr:hypothetical protein [Tenacibaculum holothuriorum]OSY87815.1 hypothetical protein WH52_10350 [Tenacibaculum holothuriorum]
MFDYTIIKELSAFVESKGYVFLNKRVPNKLDWKKGPFERPSMIKLSLVSIKVLGIPVNWKREEFFIVKLEKNGEISDFWVKVVSGFFSKTKFYIK